MPCERPPHFAPPLELAQWDKAKAKIGNSIGDSIGNSIGNTIGNAIGNAICFVALLFALSHCTSSNGGAKWGGRSQGRQEPVSAVHVDAKHFLSYLPFRHVSCLHLVPKLRVACHVDPRYSRFLWKVCSVICPVPIVIATVTIWIVI